MSPTLLLRNIYITPTVDYITFAFLIEDVAIIFPKDILSGTMEYGQGGEIWVRIFVHQFILYFSPLLQILHHILCELWKILKGGEIRLR